MSKSPAPTETHSQKQPKATAEQNPVVSYKESGWLKFLRVVLYGVSIPLTAMGAGLIRSATMSSTYLDGTHEARLANGYVIFGIGLVILTANVFWGMLRWFLRGGREQWKAGRIIGKLIGGGIWRGLVMTPLFLVGLFVLTPMAVNAIYNNLTSEKIELHDMDYAEHRLEYLNEHFDELNPQAIYDELSELMLLDLEFDPDATDEDTVQSGFSLPFETPVYAQTQYAWVLNKAVLSSQGNFVVFYTDFGDDAITEASARNLATMLEEIIEGYKQNLGFDYEYEKISTGMFKDIQLKNVLKSCGIDENILNTAMPVYVADPYSEPTNVLASYAGRRFTDLSSSLIIRLANIFGEETARFYSSTPSYPFINIRPVNVTSGDLKSVTAHELGHHYAAVYNYNTYGQTGSDDNFIDETGPNWMAINAVGSGLKEGTINGGHYNLTYLKEATKVTISEAAPDFPGYPPLAFLQNYYEIVPNAKTKIMDAIYYGDALNYLHEQAGGWYFAKVMTQLAERNLTGNYDGKLINYVLPQGEELYCTDACTHTYYMSPASTQYLYLTPDEYDGTKVRFTGNEVISASVVVQNSRGNWQVVKVANNETEINFSDEEWRQYPVVALAVSNASVRDTRTYKLDIVMASLDDLISGIGDFELGLESSELLVELGDGCWQVNLESIFDLASQVMGLGSQFLEVVTQIYDNDGLREVQNQYNAEISEAQHNLATAKAEIEPWRISFCVNQIEDGLSFDFVKSRLQAELSGNLNIYDGYYDAGMRVSAFAGVDLLARRGRGYILVGIDNDQFGVDAGLGLITFNVDPK